MQGDLAVSTRDDGLRRFLDRLGATVSYQPQQRYVVITAAGPPHDRVHRRRSRSTRSRACVRRHRSRRSPTATTSSCRSSRWRARCTSSRSQAATETVLQPRIGALDVRIGRQPHLRHRARRDAADRRRRTPTAPGSRADLVRRAWLVARAVAARGRGRRRRDRRRGRRIAARSNDDPDDRRRARHDASRRRRRRSRRVHRRVRSRTARSRRLAPPTAAAELARRNIRRTPGGAERRRPRRRRWSPAARPSPISRSSPATADGLAVRVTLSGATAYEWHRLADNRWYIDFANTTLTGPGRDERPAVRRRRSRCACASKARATRRRCAVAFTLTGEQRVDLAPSDSGLVITVSDRARRPTPRASGAGQTGGAPVARQRARARSGVAGALEVRRGDESAPHRDRSRARRRRQRHGAQRPHREAADVRHRATAALAAGRRRLDRAHDPETATSTRSAPTTSRACTPTASPMPTTVPICRRAATSPTTPARGCSSAFTSTPRRSKRAHGTTFYWYKPQDAPFAQALEKSVIADGRHLRRRYSSRELLRRAPHDDAGRADRDGVRHQPR